MGTALLMRWGNDGRGLTCMVFEDVGLCVWSTVGALRRL